MQFVNLAQFPHKVDHYLELIEKSFGYCHPYKFNIDFYPLVNEQNFHHCFMYMDEAQNIVATCAAQSRFLSTSIEIPIVFLGGIAVDEKLRNQGMGKKIVTETIGQFDDVAYFGLWSEKKQFFNALGFFDYGDQFFLPQMYLHYEKSSMTLRTYSLNKLDLQQKKYWMDCYKKIEKKYLSVLRKDKDWENIFQISSAHYLEIFHGTRRVGYAVVDKGMDLQNVIHEFYVSPDLELLALEKLNQQYSLWLPILQYSWDKSYLGHNLLLRPGKNELWNLWIEQSKKKTLFISGLDSI